MNNLVTSIIRTVIPVLVGTVITWLQINLGVTVDDATSATLVSTATGITIAAYYVAVRWLETRFPKIGWLLGLAKAPGYSDEMPPPAQPAPDDAGQTDTRLAVGLLFGGLVVLLLIVLL